MRSQFDGLRTILGNSGVAVPPVDAPAAEEPASADLPGLADLDHGVYKGDAKDAALRVDDDLFASANARGQQPMRSRQNQSAPPYASETERHVSGWTAAAVMAVGLFLGGSAAMALFHDHVAQILASLR